MNMLRILNIVAMMSFIFNTYLWIQAILNFYYKHPGESVFNLLLAFFLMNGTVWIVLLVNVIFLKEKKES
jgi:hypothetical protein